MNFEVTAYKNSCYGFHKPKSGCIEKVCQKFPLMGKLDLSAQYLEIVPEIVGILKNLTDLNLYFNGRLGESDKAIESLNNTLKNLPQLKKLNLKMCSLKQLPVAIGSLQKLSELNIEGNCFTEEIIASDDFKALGEKNLKILLSKHMKVIEK